MFQVTSPALEEGRPIPSEYATMRAGGRNISPPLEWSPPPDGTRSLAIVMVDRHPASDNWIHWLVTGLPTSMTAVSGGHSGQMPAGREHRNTFGTAGYGGPQPPPGQGDHEYEIIVYALDLDDLRLPPTPTMDDIEEAVDGHVLASASLSGTYRR